MFIQKEEKPWKPYLFSFFFNKYKHLKTEDISWNLGGKHPMEILALFDIISIQSGIRPFNMLSNFVLLPTNQQKKLIEKLSSIAKTGLKKEYEIKTAVIHIHKLVHSSESILRNELFGTRGAIIDQAIIDRVEQEILRNNLVDAFNNAGLLNHPGAYTRFKQFLSLHSNPLRTMVASLWSLPGILSGHIHIPAYLPHITKLQKKDLPKKLARLIEEKGIEATLPELRKYFYRSASFDRYWRISKITYNIGAWTIYLGYAGILVLNYYEHWQREIEITKLTFELMKELQKVTRIAVSPEKQADTFSNTVTTTIASDYDVDKNERELLRQILKKIYMQIHQNRRRLEH